MYSKHLLIGAIIYGASWGKKRDRSTCGKVANWEAVENVSFSKSQMKFKTSRKEKKRHSNSASVLHFSIPSLMSYLPWWCKSCLLLGPGLPEQPHSGQSHAEAWLPPYLGENTITIKDLTGIPGKRLMLTSMRKAHDGSHTWPTVTCTLQVAGVSQ